MREGDMIMDVKMWGGCLIIFDKKDNVIQLIKVHKG